MHMHITPTQAYSRETIARFDYKRSVSIYVYACVSVGSFTTQSSHTFIQYSLTHTDRQTHVRLADGIHIRTHMIATTT